MPRGVKATVVFKGERVTLAQLSALCGVSMPALRARLAAGATVEVATTKPIRKRSQFGGRTVAGAPRPVPKCKRHPSGRAYSRWKMHGVQRERYFGAHGSAEANAAYQRFATDWGAGLYDVRGEEARPGVGGLMVADLATRWIDHVRGYYVKGGKPTSEVSLCVAAARLLVDTYGDTLAGEFGPAALRACRDVLIARRLSRGVVNAYIARVVRCFAWGGGRSLVPPSVHSALKLVERLSPGRTTAPDRARKKPATDAQVAATIPHLAPSDPARAAKIADMIRLQRLTGMRPGEVCALSAPDLDATGEVWQYRVGASNKNAHRGKAQVYYLGPKAVLILTPYLAGNPEGPVFGETAEGYARAVTAASRKAGAKWTPHQLRHALATEVAAKFRSLEHAAAAIGDSEAVASAVYIHVDPRERAKIEVARLMG